MFDDEDDDIEINYRELPIYKKGFEIYEVASNIADLIPEGDETLEFLKTDMMLNAMMLSSKIVGAEGGGLYDIKMEAAALIRKAARELIIQQHSLKSYGFKETHYFQILRDLVEEYRLLFIDWVANFDQYDYIIDRWGLFNPPGVGPFDKDPDDDIPFDPNDFFES